MREWLKKHDIPLRLLSLLMAFLLWFYVVDQEDPTKSLTFRDMQVELIGLEALKSSHNLILSDTRLPTVTVEVNGAVSKLSGIDADDITVRADVSTVTGTGEYAIRYDISVPNGLTVVSSTPSAVTLHFGELVERQLPVEVVIAGTVKEEYVPQEPELGQSTVTVSGLAEEMERASAARVSVDASVLHRNYEASLGYEVVDAAGVSIESETIVHADRYVRVKIPVQMRKEVRLTVDLVDGKGATSDDTVVSILPETVFVQGEIADVKRCDSISLAEFDLGTILDGYNTKIPITVPESYELLSEETHADINISFVGLSTLTFRTDDIELINVPEGYTASLVDKELAITVRGPAEMVAGLASGDVSLKVDMSGRALYSSGSLSIPATVVLGNNVQGLGVFGTYIVSVEYEQLNTEPSTEGNEG